MIVPTPRLIVAPAHRLLLGPEFEGEALTAVEVIAPVPLSL